MAAVASGAVSAATGAASPGRPTGTTAAALTSLPAVAAGTGVGPAAAGAARTADFAVRAVAALAAADATDTVASVLLGVGIGWGVYGNTRSPLDFTSDPGAKPDGIAPVVLTPPRQLHSLGGLTGLLEQTRKRFGDTMGYRLVIYPEYASLDRVDPADDRRVLAYTYRGGWGDATSSAKSIADVSVVDLSKFDAKTAVGIMRGAPETLGLKQSDVKSMYLIVEPVKDPTTPAALSLSLYVSSDYGGGYLVFAGDGTIKHVSYPS